VATDSVIVGLPVRTIHTRCRAECPQPTPTATLIAQALTLVYFAFFALMPWWSRMGTFKPVPERVHFKAH